MAQHEADRAQAAARTHGVLTVGHSTRSLAELVDLLQVHGVTRVVDVRTVPRSRQNPQFNQETLPAALASAGIRYTHAAGLGGRRRPRPDSPNTGWRNVSFRGYADYMQTPAFAVALSDLLALVRRERVVVLCAEAVPWRCHRSLIADALAVRGVLVAHVVSGRGTQPHRCTPWARVEGSHITYPLDTAAAPVLEAPGSLG